MSIFTPVFSSIPLSALRPMSIVAVAWIFSGAGIAQALQFEFSNQGDVPLSRTEMAAVKRASQLWSDRLSDPITIKINVGWQKPEYFDSDTILASVQIGRTRAPMRMVRDSLLAEADPTEHSLLANLPQTVPASHTGMWMEDVSLTLANAKALGITPANDPRYGEVLPNHADAQINFNLKHYERYFYHQDRAEKDKYDFTGIAAHEIGHALGFTSIVDIQEMNPGVLLNPMLLDVFRFPGAAASPALTTDFRQTLPGDAQFYDTLLTYAAFGSGYAEFDPVHCGLPTARCSASHWDDASGNLMTSASKGSLIFLESDDLHAVDRVGLDQAWRNGIPLINVRAEFYKTSDPLPAYDKAKFSTKTEAPPFGSVIPGFTTPPTHAFHISIDGHAGTGFAVFVPRTTNTKISPVTLVPDKGNYDLRKEWEVEAQVEKMQDIPAHFSHFFFFSKNSSYHFNFVSTFSNYGAIFDPTLGAYGGFRISGFLDGDLDGNFAGPGKGEDNRKKPNDYDATITMLLLLQKPHDIKNGIDNIPFTIQWQDKRVMQDNVMHLIDNAAFDAPAGYSNSSSYEEALQNRLEQLKDDPEPGRDIAI